MTRKLSSIFYALSAMGMGLCAMVVSQTANAGIIVQEKSTYYSVEGKTGREISKDFRKEKKSSGYQYLNSSRHPIAYVHIEVEVENLQKVNRQNFCRIADADVIIKAHYLFPKWVDRKSGSANMRKSWNEFIDYVTWHEKEHVEITRKYARDYIKLLRETRFPLLGNCDVMPKNARKKRAQLAKALKQEQKRFDRKERQIGGGAYKAQLKLRTAR